MHRQQDKKKRHGNGALCHFSACRRVMEFRLIGCLQMLILSIPIGSKCNQKENLEKGNVVQTRLLGLVGSIFQAAHSLTQLKLTLHYSLYYYTTSDFQKQKQQPCTYPSFKQAVKDRFEMVLPKFL